jgi:hypothetical protein
MQRVGTIVKVPPADRDPRPQVPGEESIIPVVVLVVMVLVPAMLVLVRREVGADLMRMGIICRGEALIQSLMGIEVAAARHVLVMVLEPSAVSQIDQLGFDDRQGVPWQP